ncbi:MAG: hypothetical protein E2O87_04945 [Bacteroidetes bacterium]|nr:MAG: hypothetical protein E2O87_04945 [Bacteroidota bacterium]
MKMLLNIAKKARNRIRAFRREKSLERAHRTHRLEHQEEYIEIDKFVQKFRCSGGMKYAYSSYKLWHLNQLLQCHKPDSILEFGSGSSTLIFSEFVRKTGGRLLSIDEEEKWATNTQDLINLNSGDTSDNIEIRVCEKVFNNGSFPKEIKYDICLEEEYEFVFIDGPSLQIDGIKHKDAVNSNVFDLPNLPKVIVVDVRKATVEYISQLSRLHKDHYLPYVSDLLTGRRVKFDYNYFSYFIRKG